MLVHDIVQPTHLLLLLMVALLVLGPKRLPSAAKSLGKGMHDFRSALSLSSDEKPAASRASGESAD